MQIWGIILTILGCILLIATAIWCLKTGHRNSDIEEENIKIAEQNRLLNTERVELESDVKFLENKKSNLSIENDMLIKQVENRNDELSRSKEMISTYQKDLKITAQQSFENYCDLLDKDYEIAENEYQENLQLLQNLYQKEHDFILTQLKEEEEALSKVRATRAAAVEAQLREQEIKDKLAFYCLQVSQADLSDIQVLENIKPRLNNPRILSMLIWSTYFQKPMTNLCNNILGLNTVCGIYKITNQTNGMCYVGQSVDTATRWKSHAKCGLGIDTPQGNKLYAAMIKDGLWNFSFELLEKCSKEQLNEKEKYYIELYQSKDFGYNSSTGVGK